MIKNFFSDGRLQKGMTYSDFLAGTEEYLKNTDTGLLDESEKKIYDTISLNLHRSRRIAKTHTPGENITELVRKIDSRQIWMVITEDWCGDSAQNLPYIAAAASLNDKIELRILLRDENPDIMDHYLTNGVSRSIPILVAFNESGEELFKWGPRPSEARELIDELKSQGYSKKEFIEKLHLWYSKNRGSNIELELADLISNHIMETV